MIEFPKWQVHRGYWRGGLRENTMQAFCAAERLGAKMIEMDVRLSKDGVPVIFHDETLDRIFHIKSPVSRMKYEDLSALNICSLQEVIKTDKVPKFINIELKSTSLFPYRLVKNVVAVLQARNKKKFLFSSFNPICLFFAKRLMPEIPRGLLLHDKDMLLSWKAAKYISIASPDYLNVNENLLMDEATRNEIIGYALPVMVWTVNDSKQAQFFLERGAKSIISDEPPPAHLR